jgi:ornithine decarboxylase
MQFSTAHKLAAKHGTPLLVLSKQTLRKSYRSLKAAIPGVDIYYAVKSNAYPEILKTLQSEGAFFDVCTNGEIDIASGCGIKASRCMHTHPIKNDKEIRYALDFGIKLFIVDNEDELIKMIPYKDKAEILVRMSIQNPACLVNLSHKFGVTPRNTYAMIEKARAAGLMVKGVCFHAGSQNESPVKFIEALEYCRDITWKSAANGTPLEIIDIGGGFPINYLKSVPPPSQFCQPINEYLERYFASYRLLAEPGRFLCGPSMTLVTSVKGRALRDGVWWYYMDEGLYGSFSGKLYDHTDYPMSVERSGDLHMSVLAGPTCDSTDVVYENISLPLLEIGDLLLFDSMGAYTNASASTFNGFEIAKVVVVD